MGNGVMDCLYPRIIGRVEHMLTAGTSLGLLAQQLRQRIGHGIERGDKGQTECGTASLKLTTQFAIDQRKQHQSGVVGYFGQDTLEMRTVAHHRPEMAGNGDIVELGQRRLGDILQRFSRGVGQ